MRWRLGEFITELRQIRGPADLAPTGPHQVMLPVQAAFFHRRRLAHRHEDAGKDQAIPIQVRNG